MQHKFVHIKGDAATEEHNPGKIMSNFFQLLDW